MEAAPTAPTAMFAAQLQGGALCGSKRKAPVHARPVLPSVAGARKQKMLSGLNSRSRIQSSSSALTAIRVRSAALEHSMPSASSAACVLCAATADAAVAVNVAC